MDDVVASRTVGVQSALEQEEGLMVKASVVRMVLAIPDASRKQVRMVYMMIG